MLKTRKAGLRYENRLWRQGFIRICGVDEAGRGPLAGPVVAAAVVLSKRSCKWTGLQDSKKLSPKRREFFYGKLMQDASVGVSVISEQVIDRINILNASLRAMEKAVQNLAEPADYLLVDGPFRLNCPVRQTAIRGGDRISRSVAAASIIAKVTRDRLMRRYDRAFPEYGFARHKGYPTRAHREVLKKRGPSRVHRLSFAPVKACAGRI